MCCRLQWYPPPRLISYKITGIGGLWGFVVPLSKVSTPVAQGPDLRHYGFSSTKPMRTGHYLVACPALNEREEVSDCYRAADICYAMHLESGAYAYVEDYLGHTYMEYGECV